MRVVTSQLAGGDNNADRVLVTENAVLVLDGATAFEPVPVAPGEYAETLGQEVARRLTAYPEAPLQDLVAHGIRATVHTLDLRPGQSPSSTISILRIRDNLVDLYVLGDSPIYYGTETTMRMLVDNRLADLGKTRLAPLVDAVRDRQRYTAQHREVLAALQRGQRQFRNRSDGYWIAETDETAAYHAITDSVLLSEAHWAVLGTDGVTNHIDATDPGAWPRIASYSQPEIDRLLSEIHRWERDSDPGGHYRPRAKCHDDKTLAAVTRLNR